MKYKVTVTAEFTIQGNFETTEAAKEAADRIRDLLVEEEDLVTDIHVHRLTADEP